MLPLDWIASHIPFAAMVVKPQVEYQRPLVTKIMELVLVGAITGGVTVYADSIRQADAIQEIHVELHDVKAALDQMRQDLYVPRVEQDLPRDRRAPR